MVENELRLGIIIALLYIIPFVITCFRQRTFKHLTYRKLIIALNYTSIYVVIINLLLFLITAVFDNIFYKNGHLNTSTEKIVELQAYYLVISSFIYLPCVIVLNIPLLIMWMVKKFRTR